MGSLNSWDTTDANNNNPPPDGWPENTMQYSEVNNTGRAVQGTMKRFFADVNGSLNGGGIANAYTLTLNEPYVAYFDGMYFACSIPATNTGAVTIDVNAIGIQSVLNRDGSALTGGELDNGGIYELRYDGTNFQLMGTIGGAIGTGQATLTNSNAPDLVDTDVALRIGASDPDSAQHLELGPQDIQSKSNATTATTMRINAAGGAVDIYEGATVRLATNPFNVAAVAPTAPGIGGNQTINFSLFDSAFAALGFIGWNGSDPDMRVNSINDGGRIFLEAADSGSVLRTLFRGDPDAAASLFQAGTIVARTLTAAAGGFEVNNTLTGGGFERVLTTADLGVTGSGVNNQIAIWNGTGSIDGNTDFTYNGSTLSLAVGDNLDFGASMQIREGIIDLNGLATGLRITGQDENDDGVVLLDGAPVTFDDIAQANRMSMKNEGVGGGSGTLTVRFTSNGSVIVHGGLATHDGTSQVTLTTLQSPVRMNVSNAFRIQGSLYLQEQSGPDTDLSANGQIWVDDDVPGRLRFSDDIGNNFVVAISGGAVGENVTVNGSFNFNTTDNRADNWIGHYFDGGANTITLENSSSSVNWPLYTTINIIAPGSGVITVTEGSGTTLFLDDGSDSVGGFTVSQGVVSITRQSASNYVGWGSGIT